jgi:hypothetical protein
MNRMYLALLPLPALAVVVLLSACAKPRAEETLRYIPPPTPAAAAEGTPSAAEGKPPAPELAAAKATPEEPPSAEDLKEFHRQVRK